MIGSILSFIGDFAKTCNVGGGDVYFECDSADLIAVKIDTVPRTNDDGHANFFIYVEPPVYSNYILPRGVSLISKPQCVYISAVLLRCTARMKKEARNFPITI